jgi:hypothetical protein
VSTLLINGCSYAVRWKADAVYNQLGPDLGYTNVINLSISGSSNDSIFRRTINHIITHKVDMVILALTFYKRQEAPWTTDRKWTDYSSLGIMRPDEVRDADQYHQYIKDRYKYDLGWQHVEKMLDDVIMFSGWLESKQIKYLIFSSPIAFNLHSYNLDSIKYKLDYIRLNPNILDLENFSANQYMYEQGGKWDIQDNQFDPNIRHYLPDSYLILNKFIVDYLKNGK